MPIIPAPAAAHRQQPAAGGQQLRPVLQNGIPQQNIQAVRGPAQPVLQQYPPGLVLQASLQVALELSRTQGPLLDRVAIPGLPFGTVWKEWVSLICNCLPYEGIFWVVLMCLYEGAFWVVLACMPVLGSA